MPTSYNGWTAAPGWTVRGGQLAPLVVAGEPFSPGVRAGDVHTVLGYVASELHRRVEPVVAAAWHQADDWGYAYRANTNNPRQLSCHASGTAIDYNATRHPNGRGGTWNNVQKREIEAILAEVNNTVRVLWGYDEMHFEICRGAGDVAAAARKVEAMAQAGNAVPGDGILQRGDTGDSVRTLQRVLNAWYPAVVRLTVDGDFGPATEEAVRYAQGKFRVAVDGIAGPVTLGKLGLGYLR